MGSDHRAPTFLVYLLRTIRATAKVHDPVNGSLGRADRRFEPLGTARSRFTELIINKIKIHGREVLPGNKVASSWKDFFFPSFL